MERNMTNEEKALELMPTKGGYYEITDALLKMAKWKDEDFAKEKQSIIEEAIGWIDYNNRNGGCNFEGWEKDFKQAMKGGDNE